MSVPDHLRRNHGNTDTVLIRLEGLTYALELISHDLSPEIPRTDKLWAAFDALAQQLGEVAAQLHDLRQIEWAGIGGEGLSAAETAKARGES